MATASPYDDYSAEREDIARRQKYAEALREQAGAQMPTQMLGNRAIPISWTQGLAQALKGGVSGYMQKDALDQSKALNAQRQSDYQTMLAKGLRQLQGTPAQTQDTSQEGTGSMDMSGSAGPQNTPAQAPDPQAALGTFASHPMGAALMPLAMDQVKAQQRRQALADILGGGKPGAGAAPAGAAPQQAGPAASNPMAGMPPQIMALMTSGDPELVGLGKALMEANKGIAQRPGAPVVNPFTGQVIAQPTPSVPAGVQLQVGPGGPVASPVPGAQAAMAGLTASQAGAQQAGAAPYKLSAVNTPGAPTLMTEQQQIEAATGKPMPIPGQAPAAQPAPVVPAARTPSPAAFPRETPAELVNGGNRALEILRRERAAGDNSPELAAEIAKAEKAAGGQYPKGPPGLRLQDQGDSAEQKKFGEEKAQLQVQAPQARAAVADATTNLQRMAVMAKEVMDSAYLGKITGLEGAVPNLPGSKAADLDARLGSLKSQVGFAVLQAMRDASKTGGALGAISDRENEILQRNLAALDKTQSPAAMKASLQQLIDYANGAQERIGRGYKDTYERVIGNQGMEPSPQGAAPVNAVKDIVNSGRRATDKGWSIKQMP